MLSCILVAAPICCVLLLLDVRMLALCDGKERTKIMPQKLTQPSKRNGVAMCRPMMETLSSMLALYDGTKRIQAIHHKMPQPIDVTYHMAPSRYVHLYAIADASACVTAPTCVFALQTPR